MSFSQNAAAPLVFTPSERVLLFGDRFAKPAGMLGHGEVVLGSGAKVGADDLAVNAIAAAYLACEQAGAVRLETRQGKAMFGLMKTRNLHLVPGQKPVSWPEGSLENWVVQGAPREPKVSDFTQALLCNGKEYSPAQTMFARLKAALAGRGILHADQKTTLKVFTSVTYALPDHVRAAAEQGGTQHVQAMLDACRQQRPELWKELTDAIKAAINWMTASGE
ncbi:MAG TPA: hypothetical protein VFJ16_20955 [Longimicrobium sp.]|nr:hypothetical protein [Longimicrobium sp.]